LLVRLFILTIWNYVDPIFYFFRRLEWIGGESKKDCVFRVRLTTYKGRELFLQDGSSIKKNDCLVKIHLHNIRILKEVRRIKSPLLRTRAIYRMVEKSMPMLADYISNHPKKDSIKGIIGVTMLDKGVTHLGFEKAYPKSRLYRLFKLITQFPIFLLASTSLSLQHIRRQKTVYLVMAKETIVSRYLAALEEFQDLSGFPSNAEQ
jgi:hypothetical protein